MIPSLVPFELSVTDQFFHQGVIHRDLTDLIIDQIESAVSDISTVQFLLIDHAGNHGGSHTTLGCILLSFLIYFIVGKDHSTTKNRYRIFDRGFLYKIHHDLNRISGCKIAGSMASHTIGYNIKIWKGSDRTVTDKDVVLIIIPSLPRVRSSD